MHQIPNFIEETPLDIKSQIDPNGLINSNFSTLLSPADVSPRQKQDRETQELNDIINQMDPRDIYST